MDQSPVQPHRLTQADQKATECCLHSNFCTILLCIMASKSILQCSPPLVYISVTTRVWSHELQSYFLWSIQLQHWQFTMIMIYIFRSKQQSMISPMSAPFRWHTLRVTRIALFPNMINYPMKPNWTYIVILLLIFHSPPITDPAHQNQPCKSQQQSTISRSTMKW